MPASPSDPNVLLRDAAVTRRVGQQRLAAGLVQGALLYLLYHAQRGKVWPATEPLLFYPLVLLSLILPILLISGLGHLSRRQLVQWMGAAAVVIVVFGLHDAWRMVAPPQGVPRQSSFFVLVFSVAFFYIAHTLVLAGAQDRQRVARYSTYFETAWKVFIQLLFSAFFVGGFWLVMWLGAILFQLLELRFLRRLIEEAWFSVPVTCFAFSCAMHVTDVRPAIVRGIRTLLLVLMAWILPVASLLSLGFLLSLPFTGVEVLWKTRHATAVLLSTSAVLVVLVNAAFQTGEGTPGVARTVRLAARVSCVLLLPLTALGIHALGLRVADYGWTPDRVIGASCLLVAVCYAVGYAWAALRRGDWLQPVREVNICAALLVLAVLFALFTPIADPARISVSSQMARLEQGKVAADKFDYYFLRFRGERYGEAALRQLAARPEGDVARERAARIMKQQYPGDLSAMPGVDIASNLKVWPEGAKLPSSFPLRDWNLSREAPRLPLCLTKPDRVCDTFLVDMDGDGHDDVLVVGEASFIGAVVLAEGDGGRWSVMARLPYDVAGCEPLLQKLRKGQFALVPTRMREIEIGGMRLAVQKDASVPLQPGVCAGLTAGP
jgi:hypothetical protein